MLTESQKIKHLYNRAGFGHSAKSWSGAESWSAVLKNLLDTSVNVQPLQVVTLADVQEAKAKMKSLDKEDAKEVKQLLKNSKTELNQRWLNEMVNSKAQLTEKMALFWHGHFACKSINPYFDQQYLEIIRNNALGNFSTLLNAISRSPAMLQFLNNQQNKKEHPNENFAREVMELFTLGRGNYTEQDIKEAARAFTGWGFDLSGQFKFRTHQHDSGIKTLLGKTGNFSGDDILQMILENKACATFITNKIYTFFVNDIPDKTLINQLSEKLYQSGYDISVLMKAIFSSDWFYDEKNIGVKIKSPVELMAGMFRLIPVRFENEDSNVFIQRSLGQVLLNPPGVAGWSGGRSWIDSSSLLFRMRLPQLIYFDKEIDFAPKDEQPEMGALKLRMTDDFMKKAANNKLKASADWTTMLNYYAESGDKVKAIAETILAKPAPSVLSVVKSNTDFSTEENAIKSCAITIFSLPEYQLT